MLTNFFIVGILGKKISDGLRVISVERNYKNSQGRFDMDNFVCCHWSKHDNNYFMKAESGCYVAIRGHLETNTQLQTILFAEYVEFLGKNHHNDFLTESVEFE